MLCMGSAVDVARRLSVVYMASDVASPCCLSVALDLACLSYTALQAMPPQVYKTTLLDPQLQTSADLHLVQTQKASVNI